MLPLDPLKLAIIALVALVVLGPDKLPAAARKAASVWSDVRRLQSSLQQEVHGVVSELPFADALPSLTSATTTELAGSALGALTRPADPRQALYRSIGLTGTDRVPDAPAASPPSPPPELFGDPGTN
ncbi:MAG: Sec-independent protein translocase subunit TatA/TatB [Acidimicrobiales bacterium]